MGADSRGVICSLIGNLLSAEMDKEEESVS